MALEELVKDSEEVSLELKEDRGRFVKKPCRWRKQVVLGHTQGLGIKGPSGWSG